MTRKLYKLENFFTESYRPNGLSSNNNIRSVIGINIRLKRRLNDVESQPILEPLIIVVSSA